MQHWRAGGQDWKGDCLSCKETFGIQGAYSRPRAGGREGNPVSK